MTNTVRISSTLVMGFHLPDHSGFPTTQPTGFASSTSAFVQTVTHAALHLRGVIALMLNIFLSPSSGILGCFGDELLMGSTSATPPSAYWPPSSWQHRLEPIIYFRRARLVKHTAVEAAKDLMMALAVCNRSVTPDHRRTRFAHLLIMNMVPLNALTKINSMQNSLNMLATEVIKNSTGKDRYIHEEPLNSNLN